MSIKERLLSLIQPQKKVDTKTESAIIVRESSIDYNELGRRLAHNRSKLGKGHGKFYWKSQARVAVEYLRELPLK